MAQTLSIGRTAKSKSLHRRRFRKALSGVESIREVDVDAYHRLLATRARVRPLLTG